MPSKACKSCLQALRRQSRSIGQSPNQLSSIRPFTTTPSPRIELPKPNAGPATSIPPVKTFRAPLNQDTPPSPQANPSQNQPQTPSAVAERVSQLGVAHPYTSYGQAEAFYKECTKHASYTITGASDEEVEMPKTSTGEDLGQAVGQSWWLSPTGAGLQPTFSSWSQVTMLHMWMFNVRFRALKPSQGDTRSSNAISQEYQQHLLDHYFYDAEDKMVLNHNMTASGTRNKYLKDLHIQWRGCLVAYDEALVKGDAVLASAVWRNVFKGSEEVDVVSLAVIVSYLRRGLRGLGNLSDEQFKGSKVEFGDPAKEIGLVEKRSSLMDARIPVEEPVRASPRASLA